MDSVILGDEIDLKVSFLDTDGNYFDPDTIQLDVVRNVTNKLYGPFTYAGETVERTATGRYQHTLRIPNYMTPGIYTAKWTFEVGSDTDIKYINFLVTEPPVAVNDLRDPPRTYGIMRDSFQYGDLGLGETDRVFLIGHADGLELNSPYQVVNMQEAVNLLMANPDSSLLRGLMEIYNAGCRDIWLVSAAPMREYLSYTEDRLAPRDDWGGLNFYERYYERLDTTYTILMDWDYPEIVVPIEAPFYNSGSVDFLTQLANYCEDSFEWNGSPRLGIIGTRIQNWTVDDLNTMIADPRLTSFDAAGKFVIVVLGEGTVMLPQMPVAYTSSMATMAAAALAVRRMDYGLTYARMNNVISLIGRDLTKAEIAQLARARINPCIRTQRGKRGTPYEIVLATDNTLSAEKSDYWATAQIRIVCKCMQEIRRLGRRAIGNISYPTFSNNVKSYLTGLVQNGIIKDYKLDIELDPVDKSKAYVDVCLLPYIGVRELFFTVECGPGQG